MCEIHNVASDVAWGHSASPRVRKMISVTTAEWHSVPGYEQYLEATRDGRVRTIDQDRVTEAGIAFRRKGKVLSASKSGGRYVVYFRDRKSKVCSLPVGHAVAATYIRPLADNEVVRWRDGNSGNNDVGNLQIVQAKCPPRRGARKQRIESTVIDTDSWRPLFGYETIARISDTGEVETLDRVITDARGRRRPLARRRLSIQATKSGKYVSLSSSTLLLSRAVVESWLRPLADDEIVEHVDGDRRNCDLQNLHISIRTGGRYATRRRYTPLRAEVWRPIPGTDAHEISNNGRVRSGLLLPKSLVVVGKSSRGVSFVTVKLSTGKRTSLSLAKLMRQVWPELAHEWVDRRCNNGKNLPRKALKNTRNANVFEAKTA